jgi:multiphosphoryl transfer protein
LEKFELICSMPLKRQFVCPLPAGMHARPASALEETARNYVSEIILVNERNSRSANAKSVLAIIGADIRHNDACTLNISGTDEKEAFTALDAFVEKVLPHCDDVPGANVKPNDQRRLPLMAQDANVKAFHGICVVGGVALGRIVQIGGFKIPPELLLDNAPDVNAEKAKLDEGLQKLIAFYDGRIAVAKRKIEVELLKAHRAMARDVEFQRHLRAGILDRRRPAAGAIADAENYFTKMLASAGSELLRERALDVQDVCSELVRQIYGQASGPEEVRLQADSIVVAETLTPGQFLALDRNYLKGLALAHAGITSHTVILARSFGIPTLTGMCEITDAHLENEEAVLDADGGALLANLTERARRYYVLEQKRLAERRERMQRFAARPAATQDGRPIEIGANIASAEEAPVAFAAGAEGIGLFRTEMLFLDRESAPDETEQFEIYRRALEAANNRVVIIRTLDIGGDKPVDYLDLPAEENPFLGGRGVRLYARYEPLFRTQVRALVRASAHGKLKLLVPMIATVEEARQVKKIISEEQQKCAAEKTPFDPQMPIGAMLEVPSAAFMMDALCCELDFFSIGSNDLLQYFMAADRGNACVKALYSTLQPAFLRLLKQIVDAAHANKKWIGLCGEVGGNKKLLPLIAGLGLDEISVTVPAIAGIKAELAEFSFSDCQRTLAAATQCATVDEVAAVLRQFATLHGTPLTEPALMVFDSDAQTKEEAIKQAADRLYVTGRTDDSREIEEAIWQREQSYSTGFGNGFAIPHCRTDAVRFNSLALLKLRTPVEWNSLDGQAVRVAVLFAVRENGGANEHMKVLARLARLMIDDGFRARIENENNAVALCIFLHDTLKVETACYP